jgi:hypothetical protein
VADRISAKKWMVCALLLAAPRPSSGELDLVILLRDLAVQPGRGQPDPGEVVEGVQNPFVSAWVGQDDALSMAEFWQQFRRAGGWVEGEA